MHSSGASVFSVHLANDHAWLKPPQVIRHLLVSELVQDAPDAPHHMVFVRLAKKRAKNNSSMRRLVGKEVVIPGNDGHIMSLSIAKNHGIILTAQSRATRIGHVKPRLRQPAHQSFEHKFSSMR